MATLTFLGGAGEVTGSRYLLETDNACVLLECGLRQGGRDADEENEASLAGLARKVDAVVLSHAHLDHSGLLPKLVRDGYTGPIYCTPGTEDLLEIMLRDSAFIMAKDIEWENRHRERADRPLLEPLYTVDDVVATLKQCKAVTYGQSVRVAGDVDVVFREAGHILGSAIVELGFDSGGVRRRLVFSGDLGNPDSVLMNDFERIEGADVVLMESTYGNRNHRPLKETIDELAGILAQAHKDGGNVLIPAFAVGRTQEILYHLALLYHDGRVPQQRIFLDAPMGTEVSELYVRSHRKLNAEDLATLHEAAEGDFSRYLPPLRVTRSVEDSMQINRLHGGAIIIAGSGMCDGGRIRHHLRHNLSRRECHVVIAGFQAGGTLGRRLVDGASSVHLLGDEVAVNARIHTLGGFSAHAGQSHLVAWAGAFRTRPVFYLVHGEQEAREALRDALEAELGTEVHLPGPGDSVTI